MHLRGLAMALNKYKFGKLLELCEDLNDDLKFSLSDVKGISIKKVFIETKADMEGVSLKPYRLVKPDEFAYVTVTSRNGEKITLAHNTTDNTYIVSSSYIVFRVKRSDILLSDYLYIYFNRPEFDRYSRFNSWGSARETFSWDDFCDIDIELPSISIQQKYVDIYNAMLANQKSYERGLDDLKLVCDAYIENLRSEVPCEAIGSYIREFSQKNGTDLNLESVRGIATSKTFIETKANMDGVPLDNYKIVRPGMIAYISDTSRRGDKISLALNESSSSYLVSSISTVISTEQTKLLSNYLFLFFSRLEFDRYARYNSWGSARETFDWNEMCNVKIPIPNIEIQQYVVNILEVLNSRKEINEKLKCQIKDICPILIKGSIEEGKKSMEK